MSSMTLSGFFSGHCWHTGHVSTSYNNNNNKSMMSAAQSIQFKDWLLRCRRSVNGVGCTEDWKRTSVNFMKPLPSQHGHSTFRPLPSNTNPRISLVSTAWRGLRLPETVLRPSFCLCQSKGSEPVGWSLVVVLGLVAVSMLVRDAWTASWLRTPDLSPRPVCVGPAVFDCQSVVHEGVHSEQSEKSLAHPPLAVAARRSCDDRAARELTDSFASNCMQPHDFYPRNRSPWMERDAESRERRRSRSSFTHVSHSECSPAQ